MNIENPYVSNELMEFLRKRYSIPEYLRFTKGMNADMALGFMKGAEDVIGILQGINNTQNEME